MKACIVALFLLAACGSTPNQSQTQLNPAKDPACAECPPECCSGEAKKAEGKSECCAEKEGAKQAAGKSECCAASGAPKADGRN
jgi:hypothetical protein